MKITRDELLALRLKGSLNDFEQLVDLLLEKPIEIEAPDDPLAPLDPNPGLEPPPPVE